MESLEMLMPKLHNSLNVKRYVISTFTDIQEFSLRCLFCCTSFYNRANSCFSETQNVVIYDILTLDSLEVPGS